MWLWKNHMDKLVSKSQNLISIPLIERQGNDLFHSAYMVVLIVPIFFQNLSINLYSILFRIQFSSAHSEIFNFIS